MEITLNGLSKHFGKKIVLDQLDCKLAGSTIVALIGSNGAGKSTLLKTLSTLYTPTHGEILIDGQPLSRNRIDLRRRLHFLSDSPFFVGNTPIDHVCMAATLYQRPLDQLKKQIIDWFRQFELLSVAEQSIETLSRGQKYKVAFVGLLAANPDLWLLDEPFAAGVDPGGIAVMRRCVNKAVGGGATVIYSTQIVELAEQFSNHLLVLHQGKITLDRSIDDWNRDKSRMLKQTN